MAAVLLEQYIERVQRESDSMVAVVRADKELDDAAKWKELEDAVPSAAELSEVQDFVDQIVLLV